MGRSFEGADRSRTGTYRPSLKAMRPLNICALAILVLSSAAIAPAPVEEPYQARYAHCLGDLRTQLQALSVAIGDMKRTDANSVSSIRSSIHTTRRALKAFDLWARYLDPINHRRLNGPLPVEWETEVFEKYEKPYRREGAGLTLAELYLDEAGCEKDSLLRLVSASLTALGSYEADSVTTHLSTPDHFLFCNRLMLLNLAAIYTTGFECPDTTRVIPELRDMLAELRTSTEAFNSTFPEAALPRVYAERLAAAIGFERTAQCIQCVRSFHLHT